MREQAPENVHEKRFQRFTDTGQEQLRLELALEGYFDEETPPSWREAYLSYLRKRRRAAGEVLALRGQAARVKVLQAVGVLDERDLQVLLRRCASPESAAAWLRLLHASREDELPKGAKGTGTWPASYLSPGASGSEVDEALALLRRCRSDLYSLFPFLGGAVAALTPKPEPRCRSIGTDGQRLYFSPRWVMDMGEGDPSGLLRSLLHLLLHCLHRHLWLLKASGPQGGDGALFSVACDVAVEFLIEQACWQKKSLRPHLGHLPQPGLWSSWYDEMDGQIRSPRGILEMIPPAVLTALAPVVERDDPVWWNAREADIPAPVTEKKWAMLASAVGDGEGTGKGTLGIGQQAGGEALASGLIRRGRHDYRRFLSQFAVPKEEMELDTDSFDYIYYTLGLTRLGSLPLIEPLEYREGHKLEELVIAIDTSGSCKLDTVRRFLEESYAILDETENFFRTMNVWIFQCDCIIQHTAHIRSRADWDAYLRGLKIYGRAGTDFRPVFRQVEKLRREGELKNLKALLYFTDGDGVFPGNAPDYKTAFLFEKETAAMTRVPKWAEAILIDGL